jgi:hypothetical protein
MSTWNGSTLDELQEFVADDRFADNISRAVDMALDARDFEEQERLEEIEAEREGRMTEMSGYPDAAIGGRYR